MESAAYEVTLSPAVVRALLDDAAYETDDIEYVLSFVFASAAEQRDNAAAMLIRHPFLRTTRAFAAWSCSMSGSPIRAIGSLGQIHVIPVVGGHWRVRVSFNFGRARGMEARSSDERPQLQHRPITDGHIQGPLRAAALNAVGAPIGATVYGPRYNLTTWQNNPYTPGSVMVTMQEKPPVAGSAEHTPSEPRRRLVLGGKKRG